MSSSSNFEGVSENTRLVCDLEFVQALCNASYLRYLATNNYFADPAFMAYLSYLKYWKSPEYTRLLQFPQCLAFLDHLLESEDFRNELSLPQFTDFVHQQQASHWMAGKPAEL
jgi:mediator of RNA polymerase II transcription subunit 31